MGDITTTLRRSAMRVKAYLRSIFIRAMRQAWSAVIASTWPELARKIVIAALVIAVLYFGIERSDPRDDAYDDQLVMVQAILASTLAAAVGLFAINLLFVAPYQLWWEERERADKAEADAIPNSDVARLVADCTSDGVVDLEKLRAPMSALLDPNREYNEEWERLKLEEEVERARKIARAEEEERAQVRHREWFHGRLADKIDRISARTEARSTKPKWTNMPLHEVFRHVAFDSKWAVTYDRFADSDPKCQADGEYALAKEIREALARGDVSARGRHYIQGTDWGFTLASEPIPKEFWANTYMQPFGEITLRDDARCIVSLMRRTNTDPRDMYREIKLSREEVLSHWRRQQQAIGPLAPTQFAKDYVRNLQRLSRSWDDEPES